MLTFGYNTQIRRITNCTPLELVLSQPPKRIIMVPNPEGILGKTHSSYLPYWTMWLNHLVVDSASDQLLGKQKPYQQRFNKKVRPSKIKLQNRWFVFIYHKHTERGNIMHKLSPIADGPYEVASLDGTIVTVKIDSDTERVSRYKVSTSPVSNHSILYMLNYGFQIHGHFGLSAYSAYAEPKIVPPEVNSQPSQPKFIILRIIAHRG